VAPDLGGLEDRGRCRDEDGVFDTYAVKVEALKNIWERALRTAVKTDSKSILFPPLGTEEISSYPHKVAGQCGMRAIESFILNSPHRRRLERILVVLDASDLNHVDRDEMIAHWAMAFDKSFPETLVAEVQRVSGRQNLERQEGEEGENIFILGEKCEEEPPEERKCKAVRPGLGQCGRRIRSAERQGTRLCRTCKSGIYDGAILH
jgi:hypothetical protein